MAVKRIGTLNKHENPATNENKFDIENYIYGLFKDLM